MYIYSYTWIFTQNLLEISRKVLQNLASTKTKIAGFMQQCEKAIIRQA